MIWSQAAYSPDNEYASGEAQERRGWRPLSSSSRAKVDLCRQRVILTRDVYGRTQSLYNPTPTTSRPAGSLSSASTAASDLDTVTDAYAPSRVLFFLENCTVSLASLRHDNEAFATIHLDCCDANNLRRYLAARVGYGTIGDKGFLDSDTVVVSVGVRQQQDGRVTPLQVFVRRPEAPVAAPHVLQQWREMISEHMGPSVSDQHSLLEFLTDENELLALTAEEDISQFRRFILDFLRVGTVVDCLVQVIPAAESGVGRGVLSVLAIRLSPGWPPSSACDHSYMVPHTCDMPLLGPTGFTPRGLPCSYENGIRIDSGPAALPPPSHWFDGPHWAAPPALAHHDGGWDMIHHHHHHQQQHDRSNELSPPPYRSYHLADQHLPPPRRSPVIAFSVGSQVSLHPDILCCFWDLESTGLNVTTDHIIQIGATVRMFRRTAIAADGEFTLIPGVSEQAHDFSVFIKTNIVIPPEVSAITRITNDLLDSRGVELEEGLEAWRSWLLDLRSRLRRGNTEPELWMIAHNGNQFDLPLLFHHELSRLRWTPGTLLKEMNVSAIVDSVVLSRALYFADGEGSSSLPASTAPVTHVMSRSHRLSDLYRNSCQEDMPNPHNALYDAKAIASVMATEPFLGAWRYWKIAWRLSDYLQAFTRAFGKRNYNRRRTAELQINRFLSESVNSGTHRSRLDSFTPPSPPATPMEVSRSPPPPPPTPQQPPVQQQPAQAPNKASPAKSFWQSFSAKARRNAASIMDQRTPSSSQSEVVS